MYADTIWSVSHSLDPQVSAKILQRKVDEANAKQ